MMLAMIALVQSAFACGPYGGFADAKDGTWAYENGDSIAVFMADGERLDIPLQGELIAMDFVGNELLVAFQDEEGDFAVLFDEQGEEVASWEPRRASTTIDGIRVLREGVVFSVSNEIRDFQLRLTDDLTPFRAQVTQQAMFR